MDAAITMNTQRPSRSRIAIVEDEPDLLRLYEIWLSPEYVTTSYSSGSDLMSRITSDRPELVILDFVISASNGVQVARSIRSHNLFADIPLLFVTGHRFDDEALRSLKMAGAGYLRKPFNRLELLSSLRVQMRFPAGGLRKPTPIVDRLLKRVPSSVRAC